MRGRGTGRGRHARHGAVDLRGVAPRACGGIISRLAGPRRAVGRCECRDLKGESADAQPTCAECHRAGDGVRTTRGSGGVRSTRQRGRREGPTGRPQPLPHHLSCARRPGQEAGDLITSHPSESQVLDALRVVTDPDLGRDIVTLGFVKDVRVSDDAVGFTIELTTPACPERELMRQRARAAVSALPGVGAVDVTMTSRVRGSPGPMKERLIPSVKNVIPVASGKGGVGKSTVAANLALALAATGARVGIMDADVYGPSIPTLLNAYTLPKPTLEGTVPAEQYGVKIMSMGYFLREDDAIIWRGPMLHKTVQHFLGNVLWGELDYLIVDLPPGTGDVQLTLCQAIPLPGAAVVSTPQDVRLKVGAKAIEMFKQLNN